MSARDELDPMARHRVEKAVESLEDEYGEAAFARDDRPRDRRLAQQLVRGAEVDDFVPTLARIASRASG